MVDSEANYCEACQSGERLDLRPFFTFFGGKWRLALNYRPPKHDLIIEPFAGSAGYSVTYHRHKVILIERDPVIASVWRYLISATKKDIQNLPSLNMGESVDSLDICDPAKLLIGFWCGIGRPSPGRTMTKRLGKVQPSTYWYHDKIRQRIANQVEHIKHWEIIEGDFSGIDNFDATWFIDPPYSKAGRHYRFTLDGSRENLAEFCISRRGQIIVCEGGSAEWLPFDVLINGHQSNNGRLTVECVFNMDNSR